MMSLKRYYNQLYRKLLKIGDLKLRFLALLFIDFYKIFLSNYIGNGCRFVPRCSDYGRSVFQSHSFPIATWLILNRIMRCRPGGSCGYDPAPKIHGQKIYGQKEGDF